MTHSRNLPATFGEWKTYAAKWTAFISNRSDDAPETCDGDLACEMLVRVCRQFRGKTNLDLDDWAALEDEYAMACGKTQAEIDATPIADVAEHFRPKQTPANPIADDKPAEAFAADDEDLLILRCLNNNIGNRLSFSQVADEARVAYATVSNRIRTLVAEGLVHRKGERGGVAILDKGITFIREYDKKFGRR